MYDMSELVGWALPHMLRWQKILIRSSRTLKRHQDVSQGGASFNDQCARVEHKGRAHLAASAGAQDLADAEG